MRVDTSTSGIAEVLSLAQPNLLPAYGVRDLTPTPGLERAAYRLFLAEQRAPAQLPAVSALLEICRAEALRLPGPPASIPSQLLPGRRRRQREEMR